MIVRSHSNKLFVLFIVLFLQACANIPVAQSSVAGRYDYPLGFNYGAYIELHRDGHYEWRTYFSACEPQVNENPDGSTTESLSGWTNQEEGTWILRDGKVLLTKESRRIENTNSEREDFDLYRDISIKRDAMGRVMIVFENMRSSEYRPSEKAAELGVTATRKSNSK